MQCFWPIPIFSLRQKSRCVKKSTSGTGEKYIFTVLGFHGTHRSSTLWGRFDTSLTIFVSGSQDFGNNFEGTTGTSPSRFLWRNIYDLLCDVPDNIEVRCIDNYSLNGSEDGTRHWGDEMFVSCYAMYPELLRCAALIIAVWTVLKMGRGTEVIRCLWLVILCIVRFRLQHTENCLWRGWVRMCCMIWSMWTWDESFVLPNRIVYLLACESVFSIVYCLLGKDVLLMCAFLMWTEDGDLAWLKCSEFIHSKHMFQTWVWCITSRTHLSTNLCSKESDRIDVVHYWACEKVYSCLQTLMRRVWKRGYIPLTSTPKVQSMCQLYAY